MDSSDKSKTSTIQLRKYAKRPRLGLIKMDDGSIRDVPNWSEESDRVTKVNDELRKVEKYCGKNVTFLR